MSENPKPVRAGLVTLLTLVLTFGVTAAATAASHTAYSDPGYYTVAGVQYQNQAMIYTEDVSHLAKALTQIKAPSQAVSSGTVGTLGRLFHSNGSLQCSGTYAYNSGTLPAGVNHTSWSCAVYQQDAWYSKGTTKAWNGGGYTEWFTFQSRNQNS